MAIPIRIRHVVFIVAFILIAAGGSYYAFTIRSLSGTYISHDAQGVRMLRLVETEAGKLSGQLASVKLKDDGTVEDLSGSVEGVTDGKNISITFKPSLLPMNIPVTGTRDGNNLTLTASIITIQPITRVYISSDLTEFQALSSKLRNQSQAILEQKQSELAAEEKEKQEGTAIGDINSLVSQLENTNKQFDAILSKPTTSDKKYRAITQQLHGYLGKVQSIPGDRFGYQRGQIIYAMNQGTFASNQIHFNVQSAIEAFRQEAKSLLTALPSAEQKCYVYSNKISFAYTCANLKTAADAFRSKGKLVENRLNSLEQAYQAEYKTQEGLIEEAGHVQ